MTPPKRIAYRLSDADCGTVITTPARKELASRLAASLNRPVSLLFAGAGEAGPCLDELARADADLAPDPDDIDRPSFIIYTSGTTGRAKGRPVVGPRHDGDCRCVLGADLHVE